MARISHRPRLSFSTFTKYVYDDRGGEDVDVYVIDTGINIDHDEFEGRASWGTTIPQNDRDEDGNGHGTHCAGTIASRKYGVAKKANVYAVKVLGSNGSGTMSDVVKGVTYAAQTAQKVASSKSNHKGSVANMSLGGGKSVALNKAVNKAVDGGLHFAVAAGRDGIYSIFSLTDQCIGNDNKDACHYSPAGAENAVTVGASTLADERAYFSNFGPCVDVFGPGKFIIIISISWSLISSLQGSTFYLRTREAIRPQPFCRVLPWHPLTQPACWPIYSPFTLLLTSTRHLMRSPISSVFTISNHLTHMLRYMLRFQAGYPIICHLLDW